MSSCVQKAHLHVLMHKGRSGSAIYDMHAMHVGMNARMCFSGVSESAQIPGMPGMDMAPWVPWESIR